jgi:hypothetical protein
MDLKETGCKDRDWIQVAHSKVHWQVSARMVMNLRVLYQLSS